jgi:ABC-type uncharacterized transport system permease subunit
MHSVTILKVFVLSQGLTFGALTGALLGVFSIPLTGSYFPLAVLVATAVSACVGLVIAAARMRQKQRHRSKHLPA